MAIKEFKEMVLAKLAHTTVTVSEAEDSQLPTGGSAAEGGIAFGFAAAMPDADVDAEADPTVVVVVSLDETASDHNDSRSRPLQQE